MNNNKKIQRRPFLILALAAACILVVSESGIAATNGSSSAKLDGDHDLTSVRHGVSSSSTVKAKSIWRGATYAEWTQRWWQWWMSIPLGVNPSHDTTNAQCGINQNGSVWFIGGAIGGTFNYSCAIPQGKAILSPIIDYVNDYPCPAPPSFEPASGQTLEDFLTAGVMPIIDGVTLHTAELDGKPLHELRITSDLFPFTAAADLVSVDSCVTSSPQLGVSDGYFLFIEPLSVGHHILHIHSEIPSSDLVSDAIYDLNITK